jgi:hypothetical protein
MLLRAAILILLVLNLGVAAWWWSGVQAPRPRAASAVEPGPQLRLVSEIAARPDAPPEPASGVALAQTDEAAPTAPETPQPAQCVRLGPYPDAAARDEAQRRVAARAERVIPRDVPARSGRGWRVILPPLGTRDEATALAERMRAAGVSDLYVLNQGSEANAIALGRYGNEEAARRREADLRARGFAAQAEPLGGGTPQWWLDARLRAGVDPAALAAGAVRAVDCAGLR